MANQTYQLPYDSEHDKDIHEWLNELPRNRKGEIVRYALRYYMKSIGVEVSEHWAIPTGVEVVKVKESSNGPKEAKTEKQRKKKPSLPTNGDI